jgi:hypothetical protein
MESQCHLSWSVSKHHLFGNAKAGTPEVLDLRLLESINFVWCSRWYFQKLVLVPRPFLVTVQDSYMALKLELGKTTGNTRPVNHRSARHTSVQRAKHNMMLVGDQYAR